MGFAAPAHAYDRELFAYAASHMIEYKDIPAVLDARRQANFSASESSGTSFLCGDDAQRVEFDTGNVGFFMNYPGKGEGGGVSVSVYQYASSAKAIKAFNAIKSGLKQCAGPSTGQQTFDDGAVDTWSRVITTGEVPMVTIAGVPSVFMNTNYDDVTTGGEEDFRFSSDSYQVFTLLNDVVINTSSYTGSELNLPTKKRQAVNRVAFNAVTQWLR